MICLYHLPADGDGTFFNKCFDFFYEFFGRHTVLGQQSPLHGTDHGVAQKFHSKLVRRNIPQCKGETVD